MKRNSPIIAIGLYIGLLSLAQSSWAADDFDAKHAAALAKNPPGVHCTLRLESNQATYQQGEAIHLAAGFTADTPNSYMVGVSAQIRPSWISFGEFHVDNNQDAIDPLADFPDPGGVMYSGPPPEFKTLSTTPAEMQLVLNEWLRFDQPGTYRIYATSNRVYKKGKDETRFIGYGLDGAFVASNIISITIVPTDEVWARSQVQNALAALANQNPYDRENNAPLNTLRYLNTPEAVGAMIEQMGADAFPRSSMGHSYWWGLGLVGYKDRALVVGQMEAALVRPDYRVTQGFLNSLAQLKSLPRNKAASPAANAAAESSLMVNIWHKAADALPTKTGPARSMTIHSLLELAWYDTRVGKNIYLASRVPELRKQLAEVVNELPPLPLEYILGSDWPMARDKAMLPALRTLWNSAKPGKREQDREIATLVLQRLYELAPSEGRKLILAEIKNPHPRAGIEALGLLPEATLPEMGSLLVSRSRSAHDYDEQVLTLRLIERYAGVEIFDQVKNIYGENDGWACACQSAFLAYFLRVRPEYGMSRIHHALASRRATGCYQSLFTDIASLHYDSRLEQLAIASLNDTSQEVVLDAARMLAQYGSANARDALLTRLSGIGARTKGFDQAYLETTLVEAITNAQGWIVDAPTLKKIQDSCTTKQGRESVIRAARADKKEAIRMQYSGAHADLWYLGNYSGYGLKTFLQKLSQFPRGTVFIWQKQPFVVDGYKLSQNMQSRVRKLGMTLKSADMSM